MPRSGAAGARCWQRGFGEPDLRVGHNVEASLLAASEAGALPMSQCWNMAEGRQAAPPRVRVRGRAAAVILACAAPRGAGAGGIDVRLRRSGPGHPQFLTGREEIVEFLTRKWRDELDYALRKDLWAFADDRIAVRFQYEWHDESGQWWRSYGNENWEFDPDGYMRRREASINDVAIEEAERRIFGSRADDERDQPLPLM